MIEQTKHEMERQQVIRKILDENSQYLGELLESWNKRRQQLEAARRDREIEEGGWDL